MAVLLVRADSMFPEGNGKPRAVAKDGEPAPLINELVFNAKTAVDSLWKACLLYTSPSPRD